MRAKIDAAAASSGTYPSRNVSRPTLGVSDLYLTFGRIHPCLWQPLLVVHSSVESHQVDKSVLH